MNGNKTSLRFQRNETTLLPERSLVLGLVTSMVGKNETKCCFEKKRKMKQCKGGQSGVAVNSDIS